MSYIALPQVTGTPKLDVFNRAEGADIISTQAVVEVNPTTGDPLVSIVSIPSNDAELLNDNLFSIDASCFGAISIQLTGTWAGTFTFQASNDNVNWASCVALPVAGSAGVTTTTGNGSWIIPVTAKYIRVRKTTHTSGTTTAFVFGNYDIPVVASPSSVTLGASTSLVGDVGNGARATSTNANLSKKIATAAGTNATSVKTTAGRVYGWNFSNLTTTWKFVRLHNKASAPTVGTDSPTLIIPIPPNGTNIQADNIGVYYSTGIAFSITGAAADLDATAVALNDVIGELRYA